MSRKILSSNPRVSWRQRLHRMALRTRAVAVKPYRDWCMQKHMANGTAPMHVLFYHRVSNRHANDWTISVQDFRRHVEYCCRHLEGVDLAEAQSRIRAGRNARPTFTFTFDDGYEENIDHAIPMLLEHGVPTTYFVTTKNIKDGGPFPHDVDCGHPLPVNSIRQIREMSDAGIEIGLHTRTHPDFSKLTDPKAVREEIHGGKQELEDLIGREVRYFAVPYGLPAQMTSVVFAASREAGLHGVCSAYGGYNLPGGDAYHLRRFHGDPEFGRFQNWLSFDPRKVAREPLVDSSGAIEDISQAGQEERTSPEPVPNESPSTAEIEADRAGITRETPGDPRPANRESVPPLFGTAISVDPVSPVLPFTSTGDKS